MLPAALTFGFYLLDGEEQGRGSRSVYMRRCCCGMGRPRPRSVWRRYGAALRTILACGARLSRSRGCWT